MLWYKRKKNLFLVAFFFVYKQYAIGIVGYTALKVSYVPVQPAVMD